MERWMWGFAIAIRESERQLQCQEVPSPVIRGNRDSTYKESYVRLYKGEFQLKYLLTFHEREKDNKGVFSHFYR